VGGALEVTGISSPTGIAVNFQGLPFDIAATPGNLTGGATTFFDASTSGYEVVAHGTYTTDDFTIRKTASDVAIGDFFVFNFTYPTDA